MTRARTLRYLCFGSLPLAAALVLTIRGASTPDARGAAPRAHSPAGAPAAPRAARVAPRSVAPTSASQPAASTRVAPAPQPEEPLELRDDFRSRSEREHYYQGRSQYEAELASALRRVASELSDVAEADADEPALESERGAQDVNLEALSERIRELEAEAERHAQRSTRYAAAR
jgi:hypothetical protein